MPEILRYVDPNAAAGGNGTTNALTGENCAYTSLSAWEAATQQDLVTNTSTARVVCSSNDSGSTHLADTTSCTIDGWTTSSTYNITIEAASNHKGKWNDNIYRLSVSGTYITSALVIKEAFTKVIGLQVEFLDAGYVVRGCISCDVDGTYSVDKCILRKKSGTGNCVYGVANLAWYGQLNVTNCIIIGTTLSTYGGLYTNNGNINYPSYFYNNTIINCVNGVKTNVAESRATVTNCLFSGCTNDINDVGVTTDTYCATTNDNTKGLTTDGTGNRFSQTFSFVDAANGDYHLASNDDGAKDHGTDLSSIFTDDIDGETRSGTWDIGADEYVQGLTFLPHIMRHHFVPEFIGR